MSGGVYNVLVRNSVANVSGSGLYIKSCLGRGGMVANITYENVRLRKASTAIEVTMDYGYFQADDLETATDDLWDADGRPLITRREIGLDGVEGAVNTCYKTVNSTDQIPVFMNFTYINVTIDFSIKGGEFNCPTISPCHGMRLQAVTMKASAASAPVRLADHDVDGEQRTSDGTSSELYAGYSCANAYGSYTPDCSPAPSCLQSEPLHHLG